MTRAQRALGLTFVAGGLMHFVRPQLYARIMPDYLPAHRELIYASGVAEAAGGALVLAPATRRAGGWLLIATLMGIFPANVWMAQHPERYEPVPKPLLYARLPGQGLFLYWVYRVALRRGADADD